MLRNSEHEEIMRWIEQDAAEKAAQKIRTYFDVPIVTKVPDEPILWLVEGMIPRSGVVLLAGESGAYKTWLALALARAVATGGTFLGRRCTACNVLYLDRENPAAVMRKRYSVLGILDIGDASEEEPLSNFRVWGGWLPEAAPAIGDARLLQMAVGQKLLIIVDSLIRFHDADENSANEMATVMADLRALANAGASVVVLHHKGKTETSRYRGSSDIHAGVDVAFAISYDRETGILRLECFKNRLEQEFSVTLRPDLEHSGDFVVTEAPALSRESNHADRLREVIESEPGLPQNQVIARSGLPEKRAIMVLRAYAGRLWNTQIGPHGALRYFPLEETDASVEITL